MSSEPRFLPSSGYDRVDAQRRVRPVVDALAQAYPDPQTALSYRNPFELLISVILSAQSTDENVNKATPKLFERYPTPEALAEADPGDVEELVYSTGFFRQKTKSIISTSRDLVERFGGEVPQTLEELTSLRGVARKTANVVLSALWPYPQSDHGIFVDTHVRRVSQRLAFTPHEDPVKIERDLMVLLPRERWWETPHQMIFLGRGPCEARRPQHEECPLLDWCPTGREALGIADVKTRTPKTHKAKKPKPPRTKSKRATPTKAGPKGAKSPTAKPKKRR